MLSQDFLSKVEKHKELINSNKWDEWGDILRSTTGYTFDDAIEFGKICDIAKIRGYFTIPMYYNSVLYKLVRAIQSNVEGKINLYWASKYIEFDLINEDGELYISARIYFKEDRVDVFAKNEMSWNEFLEYFEDVIRDNNIKISNNKPTMYKVNLLN